MYLDLTGCERLYGEIGRTAARIQEKTLQELGLGISMGIASSKVVARIASGLRKPKGFVVVPNGQEELFLAPLPLSKLPGIGRPTERRLREFGIHTIGELAALPKELLLRTFGSVGGLLHERARGLDGREVIGTRIPKSISRETTFEQDTIDGTFIRSVLKYLCERVGMELRRLGRQCRTITGKIRYGDFGQIVRSRTLPTPTDDDVALFREVLALFSQIHTRKVAVRLVGVAASGLITVGRQSDLLDLNGDKRGRINDGIDRIRSKYGFNAIDYGDTMQLRQYYSEDENGLRLKTPSLSR
jgi:DNA polymerase-4